VPEVVEDMVLKAEMAAVVEEVGLVEVDMVVSVVPDKVLEAELSLLMKKLYN